MHTLLLLTFFSHVSAFHRAYVRASSTCQMQSRPPLGIRNALIMSNTGVVSTTSSKSDPVVVIGAGPAGLSSAIMLARRGYSDVRVFEKMSPPPRPDDDSVWGNFKTTSDRLYMIGINGRGQRFLNHIDCLNEMGKYTKSVLGRKDWSPGQNVDTPRETIFTAKKYTTLCIQRDRLTASLLEQVQSKYANSIKVEFNMQLQNVEWKSDENCALTFQQVGSADTSSAKIESKFVIGADGVGSKLREEMASTYKNRLGLGLGRDKVSVKHYDDNNVRVYRTIPMYIPPEKKWRGDLNYSARTKDDINCDALPTPEGPLIGVVLYRPGDDRLKSLKSGADARAFFERYLPMFSSFVKDDDLERFAQKRDSRLPSFSYAGPSLHRGKSTVILGDAIHTVKPYFGQGANSAFEDVSVLNDCLDETHDVIEKAVPLFTRKRAKDAEALVKLSRSLDGGFLTFVLPLIVDSILNRALPWLFSQNTITSLQDQDRSFSDIWRTKLKDRILQGILGSAVVGVFWKVVLFLRAIFIQKIKLPAL